MMKQIVALAVLASLPELAIAQPAAPDPSTPAGMGAALGQIMELQRAQLRELQQIRQSLAAQQTTQVQMDNTKACYMANVAHGEGTEMPTPSGATLICRRVYPMMGSNETWRLAWERL